jgi:hypothetical protein
MMAPTTDEDKGKPPFFDTWLDDESLCSQASCRFGAQAPRRRWRAAAISMTVGPAMLNAQLVQASQREEKLE